MKIYCCRKSKGVAYENTKEVQQKIIFFTAFFLPFIEVQIDLLQKYLLKYKFKVVSEFVIFGQKWDKKSSTKYTYIYVYISNFFCGAILAPFEQNMHIILPFSVITFLYGMNNK